MGDKNKHGLPRDIPSAVKREVRKRCGFGCVVCGLAIIQYEHMEPEFSDAKEHDSEGITALCGACHDKRTRGVWSKEKIKYHNDRPKCLSNGFAADFFDIGHNLPVVTFGTAEWVDTPIIINAFGETIFGLSRDSDSGMVQMSGIFHNDEDHEIFRIDNNEWKGSTKNFDINVIGKTLTIRKDNRKIALKINVEPPNVFVIEEIEMLFRGAKISGKKNRDFKVVAPDGSTIMVRSMRGESCTAGIIIENTGVIFGCQCNRLSF